MSTIYIISAAQRRAVIYRGKLHHMSIRAAVRRFAPDGFAVEYYGAGHFTGRDILKARSAGTTHLSTTERDLMRDAAPLI